MGIVVKKGNTYGGEALTSVASKETTTTIATGGAKAVSKTINIDTTGDGGSTGDDEDYVEVAILGDTHHATEATSVADEGGTNTVAKNGAIAETKTVNVNSPRCRSCKKRGKKCKYCE